MISFSYPHPQSKVATCPLCGFSVTDVLTEKLRRGTGTVAYCEHCDHGFLVTEKNIDLEKYYSDTYRQEYSHKSNPSKTNAREIFEVYKDYQKDRLRYIMPYLTNGTNLLEVGASSGQFLVHIKDLVASVNAIELDKDCCNFLNINLSIDADSNFLEKSRFAGNFYDIVCAFQVIEHVENPIEFLKILRNSTKKSGYLFIEAPNLHDPLLSIWDVPNYKKFFYHSAHLHYFTEASMYNAAIKAGFKPHQIDISFTQDYNVLNHLHWIMNQSPQDNCHVGLREINLLGSNHTISDWLTDEIKTLNKRYISKLVSLKCTSNILMKLHLD